MESNDIGRIDVVRYIVCSLMIFNLIWAFEAKAEGISYSSKAAIIKRVNPAALDLIKDYLNASDSYSSDECLSFGKRKHHSEESLTYCKMYFKNPYGFTETAAKFVYQQAGEFRYSAELKKVLLHYLMESKRYDVDGCNQAWKDWINSKTRDGAKKNLAFHQLSQDMCEKLFLP